MKFRKCIFALAFGLLLPTVNQAKAVDLDQVIAIVNSEAITLSDYEARYRRQQLQTSKVVGQIPQELDLDLLRLLIDERIKIQAAYSNGITVSKREIESALSNMAQQNNLTPDQLVNELGTQGISPHQFIRSIEEQTLIQRVVDLSVNTRVTVSDQEVDYYLNAHKELFATDESYEVSHLYVSTAGKSQSEIENELDNVRHIHALLQQGHPFAKSAEDYSDGENRENGGYLGWRNNDQLPDMFLSALRNTAIGGVTEIMQSANGFHIMKLHSKEGDVNIVTQQNVRHILIQPLRNNLTDEEAILLLEEIAGKIRETQDFEQFARLHSDDDASSEFGGDLGWVNPGDLAPELETASLDLPLNTLSGAVRSIFGYHLVEVLDRRKKDISQDMARKTAQREIFSRKAADLYKNWFDQLRESSYIEVVAN